MLRSWFGAAGVYLDRRVVALLFLGFSSGLPLPLVHATLSAWLTEVGVSLTAIGFVSLVGLAYALKFLWSPLIDRAPLPLLTRRLARRRSWTLVAQLVLIGAILMLARPDPSSAAGLWLTVFWAVVVALASAAKALPTPANPTAHPEQG